MVIVDRVGHNTSISRIYFAPLSAGGTSSSGGRHFHFFVPGRKGKRDNRMLEGERMAGPPVASCLHNSVAAVPDLCVCLSCFGS